VLEKDHVVENKKYTVILPRKSQITGWSIKS